VEPSFVPEYQPTFQELAEQCQHRVQEARMDDQGRIVKLDVYDCLFGDGTAGLCREDQCPILLRTTKKQLDKGDVTSKARACCGGPAKLGGPLTGTDSISG